MPSDKDFNTPEPVQYNFWDDMSAMLAEQEEKRKQKAAVNSVSNRSKSKFNAISEALRTLGENAGLHKRGAPVYKRDVNPYLLKANEEYNRLKAADDAEERAMADRLMNIKLSKYKEAQAKAAQEEQRQYEEDKYNERRPHRIEDAAAIAKIQTDAAVDRYKRTAPFRTTTGRGGGKTKNEPFTFTRGGKTYKIPDEIKNGLLGATLLDNGTKLKQTLGPGSDAAYAVEDFLSGKPVKGELFDAILTAMYQVYYPEVANPPQQVQPKGWQPIVVPGAQQGGGRVPNSPLAPESIDDIDFSDLSPEEQEIMMQLLNS